MIFIKIIIALVFLLYSGSVLTVALVRISRNLKLSAFVVSFILMAAATSVPELFVGMMSAFEGSSNLAFGVVVGSNIANIALVLGFLLIFAGKLKISGEIKKRESFWVAAIAVLPFLLAFDGLLSRIDAIILLIVFAVYIRQIIRSSHFFQKVSQVKNGEDFWFEVGKFISATIVLLISAHFTVLYASSIAEMFNFPIFLIGIFVVALGTSLPELVFAYKAAKADQPKLSFGDITGSIVFNASAILGIVALIDPIKIVNVSQYYISAVVLSLLLAFFVLGAYKNKLFSRSFGVGLVVFYILFLIVELL